MVAPFSLDSFRDSFQQQFVMKSKSKFLKILMIISVLVAYFYNIYSNFALYQQRRTVVETMETKEPPALFPPVSICPLPPFDPFKLIRLGVNATAKSSTEIQYNIDNLVGINKSMTGEELIKKAAWQVYDWVKEVKIGDFLHESYNRKAKDSVLWHRSFTPTGPCLTFTAPSASSLYGLHLTIKVHEMPPSLHPCTLSRGMFNQISESQRCNMIEQQCNTTCVWDKFLHDYFFVNWIYIPSTYFSYDIFDTKVEQSISAYDPTIELLPYRIVSDFPNRIDYEPIKCLHKFFLSEGKEMANCIPIYEDTLNNSIESLCVTTDQLFEASNPYMYAPFVNFARPCKPNNNEFRWKVQEDSQSKEHPSEIHLRLKSSSVLNFYKKPVYPLNTFFESVGGSLGLFLGYSLLDVGSLLLQGISVLMDGVDKYKMRELLSLSGTVTIAVPFCVHSAMVIEKYRDSANVTSISFGDTFVYNHLSYKENITLEVAVLALTASRSLGCQLLVLSIKDICFYQCFLNDVPGIPKSSLYFDDLSLCNSHDLTLYKLKYVLPKDFILSSLPYVSIAHCKEKCRVSQPLVYHSNIQFSVNSEPDKSMMDCICSLGGIIGLYLGFSIIRLLNFIHRNTISGRVKHLMDYIISLGYRCIGMFICVLFCSYPLLKYFLNHPIYTTSTSQPILMKHVPAISLCVWPPFNARRLFTVLGLQSTYQEFMHLNESERFDAIDSLLQNLDNLSVTNMLDPSSVWYNSSWHLDELNLKSYFSDKSDLIDGNTFRTGSNVIFNACHQVQVKEVQNSAGLGKSIPVNWKVRESDIHRNTIMNVHIHNPYDIPSLSLPLNDITYWETINIKSVTKWRGLYGEDHKPGECLSQCLNDALIKDMKCQLPWMKSQRTLQLCNLTQFGQFLSFLWRMNIKENTILRTLDPSEAAESCQKNCLAKTKVYYSVYWGEHYDPEIGTAFSFDVKFINKSNGYFKPSFDSDGVELHEFKVELTISGSTFAEITDNDGYPLSQFISDIGGIIGMTSGISLLSIILMFAKYIER